MPTETLDPNANFNAVWNLNSYTLIDDGVRDPTAPTCTNDFIGGDANDDNEEQEHEYPTPIGIGTATKLTLKLYGKKVDGDTTTPDITVRLFANGAYTSSQSGGLTTTNGWKTIVFTGTWNMASLSDLRHALKSGNIPKNGSVDICATYIEIDFHRNMQTILGVK